MKIWKLGVMFFVLVAGSSIFFWQNQGLGEWKKSIANNTKVMKTSGEFKRTLASSEGQKLIQNINDRIISIKNKAEIIPLIEEINAIAAKKENQDNHTLQLYRAVLSPIKHLEGIVWRLRSIVEKSGVLHMQALGAIRKLYYQDYLYGPHIIAGINFLVEPSTVHTKFKNPEKVQDFLEETIKPELEKSLAQVQEILGKTDESWSFPWDAHLQTGHDEASAKVFISQKNRFKKNVTRSYIHLVASSLHRLIGGIEYSINYNINQFHFIINDIVKKTAINSLKQKFKIKSLPEPTTPHEIMAILNYTTSKRVGGRSVTRRVTVKKYADFLTLRKNHEVAAKNLKSAMNHFHEARKLELKGFTESIDTADHSQGDRYILNPNIIKINREDTEQKLKDIISLYESAKSGESRIVSSEVTGRQIEINLSVLFTPHKDLKVFLPSIDNGFSKSAKRGGIIVDERGRKIKHKRTNGTIFAWNYKYGLPIKWENPTFGGFLPNATSDKMYEIARTMQLTDSLRTFKDFLPIP